MPAFFSFSGADRDGECGGWNGRGGVVDRENFQLNWIRFGVVKRVVTFLHNCDLWQSNWIKLQFVLR